MKELTSQIGSNEATGELTTSSHYHPEAGGLKRECGVPVSLALMSS